MELERTNPSKLNKDKLGERERERGSEGEI